MSTMQWIITVCSLITGVSAASIVVSKVVTKTVTKLFEPINKHMDEMDKTMCQNYLVDFLHDMDSGVEKNSVQIEHAHKVYEHYVNELHGNSYVHSEWKRVMES